MGTNYYHQRRCLACGHISETHIGKKSGGWRFLLRASNGLRSWGEWLARLRSDGKIIDEYERTVSLDRFVEIVVESKEEESHIGHGMGAFKDEEGFELVDADFR